jgi:uncharacterized MAPEG superfamily protein
MPEFAAPYLGVIGAYTAIATLFLLQTAVADAAAIRAGHIPGTTVTGGHDQFLFRATRAHANTNENLTFFLLVSLTAMLAGADPWWSGVLAWGFAASRLVHMLAYYGDLRPLRSTAFAVGLASTATLLGFTIAALI